MNKMHIVTLVLLGTTSTLFTMDTNDNNYDYALNPKQYVIECMETDLICDRELSPFSPGQDPARGKFLPHISAAIKNKEYHEAAQLLSRWREKLAHPTPVEKPFTSFFVRNFNDVTMHYLNQLPTSNQKELLKPFHAELKKSEAFCKAQLKASNKDE